MILVSESIYIVCLKGKFCIFRILFAIFIEFLFCFIIFLKKKIIIFKIIL